MKVLKALLALLAGFATGYVVSAVLIGSIVSLQNYSNHLADMDRQIQENEKTIIRLEVAIRDLESRK